MEIKSEVKFGDINIKEAYLKLDNKKFQENQLKLKLDNAFIELEKNAFCGIQIPKRLIPKEYHAKFGKIDNLWKYDLPDGWRLIYTIKREQIIVLTIVLEWMNHKDYERRFKY